MPANAEYHRARRAKLIANGLCVSCKQPTKTGWRCILCKRKQADCTRRLYNRRHRKKTREPEEQWVIDPRSLAQRLSSIVHQEPPLIRSAARELFEVVKKWLADRGLKDRDGIKVNWTVADMIHESLLETWPEANECTATSADAAKKTMPNSEPSSTTASAA